MWAKQIPSKKSFGNMLFVKLLDWTGTKDGKEKTLVLQNS
jgi:hypothetical protein